MKRKTTPCETRSLRGGTSSLGFNQHKIVVTICINKEQHQEHVIATTTERPAQHSLWNTKANSPKLSRQQSTFNDKEVASIRRHHTNLHNLLHSNWNDIKSTSIRGFACAGSPVRQCRYTVTDNVLWNRAFVNFSFTLQAVSFFRRYISYVVAAHMVRFREEFGGFFLSNSVGSSCCEQEDTFGSRDSVFSAIRWTHNRKRGTPLYFLSQAPLGHKGGRLHFPHVGAATQFQASTATKIAPCH